jgi:hypothetical protein
MTLDSIFLYISLTGLFAVLFFSWWWIFFYSHPAKATKLIDKYLLSPKCYFLHCNNKATKEMPVTWSKNKSMELISIYRPVCDKCIKSTNWSQEVINMVREIKQ